MSIELQQIDCNCNDCKFMDRDFETYKKWEKWNRELQSKEFEKRRTEAFNIANACSDPKGKETLLKKANKLRFLFDSSVCLNYGRCKKFNKAVSFIPNTCQLETQECFEHRKL